MLEIAAIFRKWMRHSHEQKFGLKKRVERQTVLRGLEVSCKGLESSLGTIKKVVFPTAAISVLLLGRSIGLLLHPLGVLPLKEEVHGLFRSLYVHCMQSPKQM
jgi:hypothetical protein